MSGDFLDEAGIRRLMQHAHGMVFWQAVEAWDERQIRCRTHTHREADHPLRRGGQLSSIHLGEYGAQLMAIHGALLAQKLTGGRLAPGVLTSLRDFEMTGADLAEVALPLTGTATTLVSGVSGSIYEFEIRAAAQRLASGRISVMTLPPHSGAR